MSDTGTLPTVVTSAGLQPISPATLRAMLVQLVSATNPGYTDNLPGTLIEDIASTDVAALTLCDQARVELVSSISPDSANDYLLIKLGLIYGVILGQPTNTAVQVVFTGPPGFPISKGFLVSDGSNQYSVTDGGVIGAGGLSGNLSAFATQPGVFAVPAHTVVQLITSVPSTISLAVDNPLPGTPGAVRETLTQYRTRVLRAGLASSQGMPRYLKTQVTNVPGVVERLVSVQQKIGRGWEVIVGGSADNYAVAYAIFQSLFDINSLVGSEILVTGISQASPGVVTTDINHGYVTGQPIEINGIVGMTALNGLSLVATVLTLTSFSIGLNTTGYPAWSSGGVVTPNPRNVSVDINDYPDNYVVTFVTPPSQTIEVIVTWNTIEPNFIAAATVAQLGQPAIVDYINSIPVGQPFNILDAQHAFHAAIESVLPIQFLTRVVMDVIVSGVLTPPDPGTYIVLGDPESYFSADSGSVIVRQG